MAPRDPSLIPIDKANEHNKSCTANTDFLASALVPSFKPSLFRIMVCAQSAAKFKARITKSENTQTVIFNSDSDLVANAVYIFDLLIDTGDTVNFQFDTTLTMSVFRVQEIVAGAQ